MSYNMLNKFIEKILNSKIPNTSPYHKELEKCGIKMRGKSFVYGDYLGLRIVIKANEFDKECLSILTKINSTDKFNNVTPCVTFIDNI